METAIELARQCEQRPGRVTPKVGVVIAKDGKVLAQAHRAEDRANSEEHAEALALRQIPEDVGLSGAAVFTTLEPCCWRPSKNRTPCAALLIERRVDTVYIGAYDRNPIIWHRGWRALRDAGVNVIDFPPDLRAEIVADNGDFLEKFQAVERDSGTFAFDWNLNDGTLPIKTSRGEFLTGWSTSSADSIHAYGRGDTSVALARHITRFEELPDPSVFPLNNHAASPSPKIGDIVIFKKDDEFLLVKILDIHAGENWGADYFELHASFSLSPQPS
jgi:diaminohydroxyphosphoribosylaminopyrimidine deaminase / 5-amino-6-(5-phosphoribosylamino)uracil reductase